MDLTIATDSFSEELAARRRLDNERQYLDLVRRVLNDGEEDDDERTGVGTLSLFGPGVSPRYDLRAGFPLLTTKYVHFKGILTELLWFLRGDTFIRPLLEENCHIWSEWPYQNFVRKTGEQLTLREFETRVLEDNAFAITWGHIGPGYGRQWRRWTGVENTHDQIANVVRALRERPRDRGIILSAWNVDDLDRMALRPCHTLYQWKARPDGRLDCVLYQRSADLFLGVPFNIASASLLTMMLAQVTGLHAGFLIHSFGDAHIYGNHIQQVQLQLSREPTEPPRVRLNPAITSIDDFATADVTLEGYRHAGAIKAPVAV